MQKAFIDFIKTHHLCSEGQTVFLAVSGGIDSMVLLHLFKNSPYDVRALHVNFGLRGADSDEDEAFVSRECSHWKVPLMTKRVDTKNYATQNRVSIQMAARALRYEWFSEIMKSHPGSVVATAHHLNDSVETLLLNLVRGTGIDGLTGIRIRNKEIIRPLLFATRDEIHQYAVANSIEWREDKSNLDDHYQRNFIRLRVLPLLKELNPSLEATFSKTFFRLNAQRELMELALSKIKQDHKPGADGNIRINKNEISSFANQAGVLLNLIEEYNFNLSNAEAIVAAMNGQPGKLFFSKTHQLVVDRNELIISSFQVIADDLVFTETDDLSFTNDTDIAYLDADKITSPLIARTWREGDSFQPLGMRGKKKVSDFLIDEKISVIEKQRVTVLTSNEEIVWLVGYRIDDRFKITPQTKRVLVITKTKRPVG